MQGLASQALTVTVRLAIIWLLSFSAFGEPVSVQRGSTPQWVTTLDIPAAEASPRAEAGGTLTLLYDIQTDLRAESPHQHFRIAQKIQNAEGLQSLSSLSFSYNPEYETLTLHSLKIIRGDRVLERLSDTRFQIYQRETNLERQIYDGTLTAHTVLEDLRVGDIVEYSYSIKGLNPVYEGRFSEYYSLEWESPVSRHHIRLLTHTDQDLTLEPTDPAYAFEKTAGGGTTEFRLIRDDIEPKTYQANAPSWYNPFAGVDVSEFKSWAELHSWASDLFAPPPLEEGQLARVADDIARKHDNPMARVTAALKLVQDDIRYVGMELGANTYRPHDPAATYERRFGDCKDKTLLLNTLLRELGIKADAVLVHSKLKQSILDMPPSPLNFDHVITRAEVKGRVYWLDATDTHQQGSLLRRTPALVKAGLVLGDGDPRPVRISPRVSDTAQPRISVTQTLHLPDDRQSPVPLTVETTMAGSEASHMRGRVAREGRSFQQEYINYYRSLYPELEVVQRPSYTDNPETNRVRIDEQYRLPSPWETDEEGLLRTAWLEADQIDDYLVTPQSSRRQTPLSLPNPINVNQEWVVYGLDSEWSIPHEKQSVENDFFRYERQVDFDGDVLEVEHSYQSRVDYIPADRIGEYLAEVKAVNDLRFYGLEEPIRQEGNTLFGVTTGTDSYKYWIVIGLVAGLALVILIDFWRDRRQEKERAIPNYYYPVSIRKLPVMMVLTMGFYPLYWGYRNWKYISLRDQRRLWSWLRALFISLTTYGLYADAHDNPVQGKTLQLHKVLCGLLAFGFFVCMLITGHNDTPFWVVLAGYIASAVFLLPLQNYINGLPGNESAYEFNSRWRLRHGALALLLAPIVLFVAAQSVYLVPPAKVIKGDQLPKEVQHLLADQNMLAPQEQVLQFYSHAMFDYSKDGNGLTDQGVFSYWQTPDGNFEFNHANFSQIADIKVTRATNLDPNIVRIHLKNGSFFQIYVGEENGDAFISELREGWHKN